MYTDPLIAGTNKRHIWCVLAMRWRTVTAIDHLLLILPRINNWCLNMIYHNGISAEGDLTNEDEERLVTLHWLINIEKVELVKSHRFCDIDFKEVVIWSLISCKLLLPKFMSTDYMHCFQMHHNLVVRMYKINLHVQHQHHRQNTKKLHCGQLS